MLVCATIGVKFFKENENYDDTLLLHFLMYEQQAHNI